MGHLAICNDQTVKEIITTGYISGKCSVGDHQVKTVADIMSSFLCIKEGDYIFPWIIHNGNVKGIGFKYVFICSGNPIYVQGEPYPFKIPVRQEFYSYTVPLSENEALDLFRNQLLWNAIGKKSLGRPRSITSQTPDEDELILQLLNHKNPNGRTINQRPTLLPLNYANTVPLAINHNQSNVAFQNVASINDIVIGNLPFRSGGHFKVEKVLEAWFLQEANSNNLDGFLNSLGFNNYQFEWVGNYMPFGVSGSNIDVVAMISNGDHKVVLVIELKHQRNSINQYRFAANEVTVNAEFIERAFASFDRNYEVVKVVLTGNGRGRGVPVRINNVHWIAYEYNDLNEIIFARKC
jgi:hypothetical protein